MSKLILATDFVPGRIYSLVYDSDVDMVRKKRGETVENPLADSAVTVRRVSSLQAAGNKTWTNFLAKRGEQPVGNRPSWWQVSDYNSCICIGVSPNTKGKEYLRGLPRGITKEQYFVNGVEATASQVETIRKYKSGGGGEHEFVLLSLSKLVNVDGGQGDAE